MKRIKLGSKVKLVDIDKDEIFAVTGYRVRNGQHGRVVYMPTRDNPGCYTVKLTNGVESCFPRKELELL